MTTSAGAAVLAAVSVLGTGCLTVHTDGDGVKELKTETVNIDRGKAEMVRLDVRMGAGELRIEGGAEKLMEGSFTYNVPFFKPVVRYDATGFRGNLTVEQTTEKEVRVGDVKNNWSLRLNNDIPLDVLLHMGAGESKLNIGPLTLRRVEVHMGVGELKMDLRGDPKRDYDVDIKGGVGEATVYVPRSVGAIVHATGGIGGIEVSGMRKDGSAWINDEYGKSKVTVRVDIKGGIGQINVRGD
jgi:predicted membrane protein